MKTQNKKKIIVSTLALAMGAALAGSISGSVAWYQYSTRASAQLVGTSIGTMGQLQVKAAGLEYSDHIAPAVEQFKPISASGTAGSALAYYDHPVYQTAELPAMGATAGYIDYTLSFKFSESQNGSSWQQQVKNVYLTHFEIANAGSENDITNAVRVELIGTNHRFLLANVDSKETITKGNLDLNNNGKADRNYWDCLDLETAAAEAGTALGENEAAAPGVQYYTRVASAAGAGYLNDGTYAYIKANSVPATHAADIYFPLTSEGVTGGDLIEYKNGSYESYETNALADALVTVSNPYDLETNNTAKVLVATKASGDSDPLTVRVWLEGWELLNGTNANWTKEYIAQNFNINMQFACSANR